MEFLIAIIIMAALIIIIEGLDKRKLNTLDEPEEKIIEENVPDDKEESPLDSIKKLIAKLDFHYYWGYWISNSNKNHRIKIKVGKKRIYLNLSTDSIIFDLEDTITVDKKSINLKEIETK